MYNSWEEYLLCQCLLLLLLLGYYLKKTDFDYKCMVSESEENAHHFLTQSFKYFIQQHQRCIKLYEILYFLTERLMFVIMLGSSALLIIAGSTMVVLMDSHVPMAIKMFVCCWAAMIVILFICVPGQLLSNAGHEFFIECYCVNWHGYPPKARVLLLLILVRTKKPLVLRAGFLADLSFETCSSVLKKAASFVTALRSIYTAF
ncbi:odorant receptor 67a-like [Trichogramma pretiosum]|uniref:odorant receptor 67a-like n=1 Tax=Trichogramma pretiosum TaxID=7493 RepID=UPI000C71B80F|nr:odorant receptor 67a-like [Trichogramma pretiosum]